MSLEGRIGRGPTPGFTLIELLVVVFIVGLISGFAVLSINLSSNDREIFEELQYLRYQLTLAGEESIVRGLPVGVMFDERRYRFLLAGQSQWVELDDTEALKPHELPASWKIELRLGSSKVILDSEVVENEQIEASNIPHIVFFSSGEISPFEILVVDLNGTPKYRLWYGEEGVIKLEQVDEG
jgi:general secretion pathway protein H